MQINKVHRTGPVVRVTAGVVDTGLDITIELPHLHHDVADFQVGASLRLRLQLFSVFPRASATPSAPAAAVVAAPVLIGRERARA